MKLAYITVQVPWGRREPFIVNEMLAVKENGIDLIIIPRSPTEKVFHQEAQSLLENAVWLPLIDFRMIRFFISSSTKPRILLKILFSIVRNSRILKTLIKNLMVFPKGVFIANLMQKKGVEHIHAHWGSTTATMAYIASQITGIPWSFTLHRWDIYEDNMLREKIKSAQFVRCISQKGKSDLSKIINGSYSHKIVVVHMGINIQSIDSSLIVSRFDSWDHPDKVFTIAAPANLLPVKGHKYLIDACSMLIKEGFENFKCIFYGEGPLKAHLKEHITNSNLSDYLVVYGLIPHDKLIKAYENKRVDMVVLPSINTEFGEHEGIPVSLMEAMAYGIPVISTSTGSISELLSGGAGIICKEKASKDLAEAILKLISDKKFAIEIAIKGREKVCAEFNVSKTIQQYPWLL